MGKQLDNVMGGVLCITSSREVGGYRRLDTFQDCTRRSSWLSSQRCTLYFLRDGLSNCKRERPGQRHGGSIMYLDMLDIKVFNTRIIGINHFGNNESRNMNHTTPFNIGVIPVDFCSRFCGRGFVAV